MRSGSSHWVPAKPTWETLTFPSSLTIYRTPLRRPIRDSGGTCQLIDRRAGLEDILSNQALRIQQPQVRRQPEVLQDHQRNGNQQAAIGKKGLVIDGRTQGRRETQGGGYGLNGGVIPVAFQ